MPIPVRLQDVVDAIDATGIELQAYLDKETGDLVAISEEDQHIVDGEAESELEDYPDWHKEALEQAFLVDREPDRFLPLPGSFELDEWGLMRRFAHTLDDEDQCAELLNAIHGTGAFRLFRATVAKHRLRERWFEFRSHEVEELARDWLNENGIPFIEAAEGPA